MVLKQYQWKWKIIFYRKRQHYEFPISHFPNQNCNLVKTIVLNRTYFARWTAQGEVCGSSLMQWYSQFPAILSVPIKFPYILLNIQKPPWLRLNWRESPFKYKVELIFVVSGDESSITIQPVMESSPTWFSVNDSGYSIKLYSIIPRHSPFNGNVVGVTGLFSFLQDTPKITEKEIIKKINCFILSSIIKNTYI